MTAQERLEKQQRLQRGKAIIEGNIQNFRNDGYTNMLNKFGTAQDNSTAYQFAQEPFADDMELTRLYEGNGLFAKIIDRPSEECMKHGFDLGIADETINEYLESRYDALELEAKFSLAEKWARLYGGSIIVMVTDDGKGLEEPLDWRRVKSIRELRVFDRSIVQPDYTSIYRLGTGMDVNKPIGTPDYYDVFSLYGSFRVHWSRCLVFKNGEVPEKTTNALYRWWGIPEYVKIKQALRECMTSHTYSVQLLERCVQAIYKMKNLSNMMGTEKGEDAVVQRLQAIDMARNILNSIAIDTDGEDYDYKQSSISGVKEIIESTCNMLSAVTEIPQTVLFGRSPSGMNATGEGDSENYYNMIERIQKMNMKANLRKVIDLILIQGKREKRFTEIPVYKVEFNPLWSMSEMEQANVDKVKADIEAVKATTAGVYVTMGALDPSEVREALREGEDWNITDGLQDDDELFNVPEGEMDIQGLANQTKTENKMANAGNKGKPVSEETTPQKIFPTGFNGEFTKADSRYDEENNEDGGPGSGNWGHAGVKGKVGGSAKGSGGKKHRTGTKESGFSSEAKERAKSKGIGGSGSGSSSSKSPSVKSAKDFDKYVAENNLKKIYRGYSAKSQKELDDYTQDIKNGNTPDSNAKTSGLGKGVYYASSKEEAEGYMNRRKAENNEKYGKVSTVALDKGAKVGDYNEIQKEKLQETSDLIEKAFNIKESHGAKSPEYKEAREKYYDLADMEFDDYVRSKGYDAFIESGSQYTVVINQNALVVREDSRFDGEDIRYGCGIIVLNDKGEILVADRTDGQGTCGPGGHIQDDETVEEGAIRETTEEFSIRPLTLLPIGDYKASTDLYCNSKQYLCTDWEGEPKCKDGEMENPRWVALDKLAYMDNLYEPFRQSLVMLVDYLIGGCSKQDGGKGSGNFGHKGVKGKRGGSAKKSGGRKPKRGGLPISEKEVVKVTHEINNVYHAKYKGKRKGLIRTFGLDNRAYNYSFEINDFDSYNIYNKEINTD